MASDYLKGTLGFVVYAFEIHQKQLILITEKFARPAGAEQYISLDMISA